MNYLANFLTSLSLLCGFIAIIFSLQGHFTFAAWAVLISVVLDGLDGQIARMGDSTSEFGKELDSLVDVVSFGIAPSILGYTFIYHDIYIWAIAALFIYLMSSVMRLAKYNLTPKESMKNYFYGLPTTASGGVLASFVLIYRRAEYMELPVFVPYLFVFLVLVLSFLMVSRVRYLNLDGFKKLLGDKTKIAVLVLSIIVTLSAFFKKAGVTWFSLFLIYLIFSPFVVKRLNNK